MPRLLHLTDIHMRRDQPGSADNPLRLSRDMPAVLDSLAAKLPGVGVDVLVLTGDLLDVPDAVIGGGSDDGRDHEAWIADVDADLRWLRSWLEGTGLDWVICPGNHDHEGRFQSVFPEAGAVADVCDMRFFIFWDELTPQRQPRRSGARRDLFDAALSAPEHDVPQIHMAHYIVDPPVTAKGWRYEYVGAADMKARLEASGRVRAVLSGHYHPGILIEDGPVLYSGPPAFCEDPFPFRVYDMAPDGGITVEHHAVGAVGRQ